MIDVMGLAGDASDNIPGVPGIGQKTAVKLIQQFGSMQGVYDGIDTITAKKQKENLTQFKDQALLLESFLPSSFESSGTGAPWSETGGQGQRSTVLLL